MGDITERLSTDMVRLTGADADGTENNPVGASTDGEVRIRDTHDNGGLDIVLNLTSTPSEGKVGVSRKTNRKYIVMEALTTGVKWGFTNTSQSFDLFKSQLVMVPLGENTEIWFVAATTGQVAFGEIS